MKFLIALLSGSLFGAGLYKAGATDTDVIQGWLDVLGNWNPTLGIMFLGSFAVMSLAWKVAPKVRKVVTANTASIDRQLVAGSVLFGVGWGISGMCPGPAIASLSFNGLGGITFCMAMCIGLKLGKSRRLQQIILAGQRISSKPASLSPVSSKSNAL